MHGKMRVGQCLGLLVAGLLSGAAWAGSVSPHSFVAAAALPGRADRAGGPSYPRVTSGPRHDSFVAVEDNEDNHEGDDQDHEQQYHNGDEDNQDQGWFAWHYGWYPAYGYGARGYYGSPGNFGDRGNFGSPGNFGNRGNYGTFGNRGTYGNRGDYGDHGDYGYGDYGNRGDYGDRGD